MVTSTDINPRAVNVAHRHALAEKVDASGLLPEIVARRVLPNPKDMNAESQVI